MRAKTLKEIINKTKDEDKFGIHLPDTYVNAFKLKKVLRKQGWDLVRNES